MAANDDIRKAIVVKQTRRSIIDLLDMTYPMGVRFNVICESFIAVEEHYLIRDLAYLAERGYVRWEHYLGDRYTKRNTPHEDRNYVLTASGVEIAQKINTDSALEP